MGLGVGVDRTAPDIRPVGDTAADPWRRVRRVSFVVYAGIYVVWFANLGIIVDRISVLVSITVLLVIAHLGRPWRAWRVTAIDLTLYVAMWLVYDETRGAADRLGRPLQVTSVRDADRFLFGGVDATVWLQDRFLRDEVRWYDVVASVVYYSHFVVPIAVIAVLWIRDRSSWVRFMRRFATVLGLACVSFVLFPTAPPWMAGGGDDTIVLDAIAPVARPAGRGWDALGLDSFVHAWETGRDWANPVAAMPSLHAGFSLFVVVFFLPRVRRRPLRVIGLAYPATMAVALVYLAEHWIVDVLAGWSIVGVAFGLWHLIEARSTARACAARSGATIITTPDPPLAAASIANDRRSAT
jgi:hypothetical protein